MNYLLYQSIIIDYIYKCERISLSEKNSPTSFFRIALPWLHSEFLILVLEIELSKLRAQQEAFFEHTEKTLSQPVYSITKFLYNVPWEHSQLPHHHLPSPQLTSSPTPEKCFILCSEFFSPLHQLNCQRFLALLKLYPHWPSL